MAKGISPSGARDRRILWLAALFVTTAAISSIAPRATAQPTAAAHSFNIPPGPLANALVQFGYQSGLQVAAEGAIAASATSPGVVGSYAPMDALDRLLTNTGVTYHITTAGAVQLERIPAAPDSVIQLGPVRIEGQGASTGGSSDPAASEGTLSYAAKGATVAGKTAQTLREIPQSVSVLTRQQLDDQNLMTIEDALKQATGITVATNGNPYLGSSYFARGYALSSEYDGVPSSASLNTGNPQFDLAIYDRIEVLRGSAGLFQGSGEPGGVINFARKRPLDQFHTSGDLSIGSWDNFHLDADVTGPLNAKGNVRGRLVLAGEDRDFFYDHSHAQSGTIYGIIEADLTPDTLFSVSATVQRDQRNGVFQGLPTYTTGQFLDVPRSYNPDPSWTRAGQTTVEGFGELSQRLGDDWQIKSSLRYRQTITDARYAATYDAVVPGATSTSFFSSIDRTNYSWLAADVNATGSFDLFGRSHQILAGANYDQIHTQDQYGGSFFPVVGLFPTVLPDPNDVPTGDFRTATTQYGAYGQLRFNILDPLTLVLGGRLTNFVGSQGNGVYGGPVPQTKSPGSTEAQFTPYGGLLYAVNHEISLYASYAEIFVPQTSLTQGGSALPPRTGEEFEIGAKGSFFDNALNASVALFDLQDDHRAYNYPIGSFFYVDTGKVETQGVEFEFSGSPLPGWDISAGYTYLNARYDTDATSQGSAYNASVTPKHNFKFWTLYHFSEGPLDRFSIGGGVLASSSLVAAPVRQNAYAVFSAQIGYAPNEHWQASLTMNNIGDARYYETVNGIYSNNYFGDPRNVMFTLRLKY